MTTNEDTMGDLLRFPHPQRHDRPTVDGTSLPEPAQSDQHPADTDEQPGTELTTDTERGLVPAALGGRVQQARTHLREHGWDYTKTSGKFVFLHGYYLFGGVADIAGRTYGRWTGRDIDERIAAAQAAGEHGVVASLMQQRTESRKILLERLKMFGSMLVNAPKVLGGALALGVTVTLMVSIAAWVRPGGLGFADVWTGLADAVVNGFAWITWGGATFLPWSVLLAAAGLAAKGYNKRRRGQAVPAFLAAPGTRNADVEITSSVVVSAMQRSGIAALRRTIGSMDEHQRAAMLSPIKLAGCGVEVDVTMPSSGDTTVTTEQVRAKRRAIAEGLGRHEHEVFITKAPAARTVRLWIADSGALDEPIGPSPLVSAEFDAADVFSGRAPWGQTLRGDNFLLNLWQCHLLITGLSNQGKTAALRSLLLWLLLDPSVEIHLADLKGVGDYNMLKSLTSTYIAGASDGHVIQATEMVEWGVGEMYRRIEEIEANADTYPNGVTSELSRDPNSGFHPIVLVVDEAQVGYECPAKDKHGTPYGGAKTTSRFFNAVRKIQNQGRAVNVTFWQGTQDPTNENLPIRARNGAHIRASLVVATPSQSRMAMGDSAVDSGGAAPHELRQGKDKGVLVVKDADNTIETVRTHYVDGDAAEAVAERARTARAGVRNRRVEAPQRRDLLADVAEVLDEDKVKATDVVARLRSLAPRYQPYQDLNADNLKAQLDDLGAKVTKSSVLWVYAERVHQALAEQEGGNDAS